MKEEEIRPAAIFDEYLRLAESDTIKYFNLGEKADICCPACNAKGKISFIKHGFTYEECGVCQTLFVNPRPPAIAFSRYYTESASVQFWASTFYKETAEARRELLWKPKAQLLYNLLCKYGAEHHYIIDIGGGYGIFAEEYVKVNGKAITIIEPGPELAEICREKGLNVIEDFLEDIEPGQLNIGPKTFVSFELFEHLQNPRFFLEHLIYLMNSSDLFAFTTLSGIGLDIQVLWENSKSVSPPHHLNFLNPKSIKMLLESVGFRVLETSTPGKLDIDIICNNLDRIKDRFWRTFVVRATEIEKQKMQNFIAESGLSSHMLIVCKKI